MTKTRSGSSVRSHQDLATLIVLSGLALFAVSASAAAGGYVQMGSKLISPLPGPVLFGGGVGVSGNGQVVVVGATFVGGERGAAWVYERSGQSWRERARLVPTGPALTRGGAFGEWIAVSQNGGVIAIGAPAENKYRGAVWVFVRHGERWAEQAGLTGGTQEMGDGGFGGAVAVSSDGGTIAVGAPGDRPVSTQPESAGYGAVWIFTRNGTDWQQDGPKLVAKGDTSEGDFGDRLALSGSGTTLLVGAFDVNVGRQIGRGSAWVFTRGTRVLAAASTTSEPRRDQLPRYGVRYQLEFGGSVALSSDGQTALVSGDDQDNNHGAVWRFKLTADGWRQQGGLITTPAHRPGDTQGRVRLHRWPYRRRPHRTHRRNRL